jgi:NAD(P)-dependent dehydrogenase (short-subunit alcohol dehydrogenase family)
MGGQRYAGRVALVTRRRIGHQTVVAVQLAAEGATVVGCDVDAEGLAATAKLIEAEGHSATMVTADVTVQGDIDNLVAALPDQRIDLLANVAGIMDYFLPVTELDDETWDRIMAVNLTGPMRLCRAVLPLMRAAGKGAIVNVSSVGGLTGSVAGTAYVSAKHGILGLTRSIAYLYAEDGIRTNVVCPGGVETGIGRTAIPKVPWAYQRLENRSAAPSGRPARESPR